MLFRSPSRENTKSHTATQKVSTGTTDIALTGLAQVNGRNNINWEERFKFDLEYVENISLLTDIKIFIKTFIIVFKKVDISTDGLATSEALGDYLVRTGKITENMYNLTMNEIERKTEDEKDFSFIQSS